MNVNEENTVFSFFVFHSCDLIVEVGRMRSYDFHGILSVVTMTLHFILKFIRKKIKDMKKK